jgi:glutamine synthetase
LKNLVLAEYIWLGGHMELRGKTRTLPGITEIKSLDQLPDWNFDGSSTKQATGDNSEVFLKPVKFVPDPFRGGQHVIVLCETYQDLAFTIPNKTNFR